MSGGMIKMWKRQLDVFPVEWDGTEHELEQEKELNIGDKAKVIVDSQFNDENAPRRINTIGTVVEIDIGDTWSYKLSFENGNNWFKRYHLQKVD